VETRFGTSCRRREVAAKGHGRAAGLRPIIPVVPAEAATDSTVLIPRVAAASVAFVRADVPAAHPSAQVLGEERMGAGLAVAPDRVLTAHYLVLGASSVEVTGLDGRTRRADRVSLDHLSGLALLGVEGAGLEPLRPREGGEPRPGDPVFLLTCNGERERRGASGHVSFVGPFEAFWEYMLDRAIMTTIVNPGLAGGPLLDAGGRVAGVVSLGLAAVGRYSLAVPVSLFLERRDLLESGRGVPEAERRAWVGVYPQARGGGVVVSGVVPGGPADAAGLQRGDLVLSVDGHSTRDLRQLYRALWRRRPGEVVGLQVLRDESILVVEIVTGDRDSFYK
jgi:S1-C subfamily serine protease